MLKLIKYLGVGKTVNLCVLLFSSLVLGFQLEFWAGFKVLNGGWKMEQFCIKFGICFYVTGSKHHILNPVEPTPKISG